MKNIHNRKTVMILVVMALTSAMVASLSLTAGAQDVNPPVEEEESEESEESEEEETEDESEETETEEDEGDLPPVEETETEETETEEDEGDLPPVEETETEEDEGDLPPVEETESEETETEEGQTITVTVVRGDSLWKLARIHLGSGWRWPEIFALNKGIVQADGRALSNPDLIIIGWVLEISLAPRSDTP